jgi:hypothetical protein
MGTRLVHWRFGTPSLPRQSKKAAGIIDNGCADNKRISHFLDLRRTLHRNDHASEQHGKAHPFYNMVLVILSIFAATAVALSIIRHPLQLGKLPGLGVVRDDITATRERTEQSAITSPLRQFLVVVLPDGKIVYRDGIRRDSW